MLDRNVGTRVGVYVDVSNLTMNGGYGMRYEVLREFACRNGARPVRLNAYVSFDEVRARTDTEYRDKQRRFHSALRDMGFKVIRKIVKWYTDETGARFGKANVDLDLAVDALLQSDKLDKVLIATGDGDFVRVISTMQNKGCRVEVLGFDNVSRELRDEADQYISGYLVPNLLPFKGLDDYSRWGEKGSFVRGVCVSHEKGFGFFRFMDTFQGELWLIDNRDPLSPYSNIFFHDSNLPDSVDYYKLPGRDAVFEFEISEGTDPGKTQAINIGSFRALT
ncbi:MAG: NYN domain-containing protein [Candidatus Sabulitectum sp.]|nr:NYN domain-containing protein [Candidatus Sabulitectum sp.]